MQFVGTISGTLALGRKHSTASPAPPQAAETPQAQPLTALRQRFGPTPSYQYAMPGAATSSTVTVASRVLEASSIDLAYSTTADSLGNPTGDVRYVGMQEIDEYGLVKHTVTQAPSNTRFFAKLSPSHGKFIGDPIRFTTYPADGTAFVMKWAFGSCQRNAKTEPKADGAGVQLAWKDLQAYSPDKLWDVGDFHYKGSRNRRKDLWVDYATKYWNQIQGMPEMRKARALVCEDQLADDHEMSGNNGDSFDSIIRQRQAIAMQRIFALHPLADPHEPKRGLWGSYMLTSRIRVVLLDAYSMDRSPGRLHDKPENRKTFLGAAQDAWLRELLVQPAALNIVVCGKSWLGNSITGRPPRKEWDKVRNYGLWRDAFSSFVRDARTTDGKKIQMVWMGGDRHATAYVSGANNPYGGFPCWVGSGWSQHALRQEPGERYDQSYGFDPANKPVMQYLRGYLSDDNRGHITFTGQAREVRNSWRAGRPHRVDPSEWQMTDGLNASDTWTY